MDAKQHNSVIASRGRGNPAGNLTIGAKRIGLLRCAYKGGGFDTVCNSYLWFRTPQIKKTVQRTPQIKKTVLTTPLLAAIL